MISFEGSSIFNIVVYYSGPKNNIFYTTVGTPIIKQLSCVFVCQALKLNFETAPWEKMEIIVLK